MSEEARRVDFAALREQQREVARQAVPAGDLTRVERLVAVDISTQRGAPLYAAAVLIERSTRTALGVGRAMLEPEVPYVPGFLSFREAPAALAAIADLARPYDLLWVDGHGLTHPRAAGIATHLGVTLGVPSIGVAKKPLSGTVEELSVQAGAWAAIRVDGTVKGYAIRSRARSNPIFVSAGHLCSPEAARDFVLEWLDGYRIPLPTRLAHEAANALRREALGL